MTHGRQKFLRFHFVLKPLSQKNKDYDSFQVTECLDQLLLETPLQKKQGL